MAANCLASCEGRWSGYHRLAKDEQPGQRFRRSTIKIMTYSASIENVKTVLQWLRSNDDLQWEDQTALLSQIIDDLEKMARPKTQRDKTGRRGEESDFFSREAPAINAAIFDLIEMSLTMELGNREEAIESGKAALALLPERPWRIRA